MRDFESKKAKAISILQAAGISSGDYLPLATKALWRIGIEAPLPHFVSFGKIAMYLGVYFAITWGAFMYLLSVVFFGEDAARGLLLLATGSAAAGLLFGLSMASYYAYGRKKYQLPSWESLGQQEDKALDDLKAFKDQ